MGPIFSEDDLLPISALQHLAFCERQWALIHLERVWDDNVLTAEGRLLHRKVHAESVEVREGVRIVRGLRLRSLRLGLAGVSDVVEFHPVANPQEGVRLPVVRGTWMPFPVEFKRGRPKRRNCDRVQLCAQAMCLEEMLGVSIPTGALFYGKTRRRQDVPFDDRLRGETEALAARLHDLTRAGKTPQARYDKMCDSCSLASLCLPKAASRKEVAPYLRRFSLPPREIES